MCQYQFDHFFATVSNKVLFSSVYIDEDHVIAEGQLLSIREILDSLANRDNPPSTVAEAVRRYYEFEHGRYACDSRELVEVLFDQEIAGRRIDTFSEWDGAVNGMKGRHGGLNGNLIFCLYRYLPEVVDYAWPELQTQTDILSAKREGATPKPQVTKRRKRPQAATRRKGKKSNCSKVA